MKVFALQRRTLLGRSRNHWTGFRTLNVYDSYDLAVCDMNYFRSWAEMQKDDTVDYCVTELNVLTTSVWNK